MNPQNNQDNPIQNPASVPITPEPSDTLEQASVAAQQIINPITQQTAPTSPTPPTPLEQPVRQVAAVLTPAPAVTTTFGATPETPAVVISPNIDTTPQAQSAPRGSAPQPPSPPLTQTPQVASTQPSSSFVGSMDPPPTNAMPHIVMGGVESPEAPSSPLTAIKPNKINKKFIAIASIFSVLLLAGGATAYAFLSYIPNKPNNIWNTSMERTGTELATIMTTFQDESTVKKLEKSAIEVTGDIQWDSSTLKLTASSKQDANASETSASLNTSDTAADEKLNIALNAKTQVVTGATLPNMYFKISGLGNELFTANMPELAQYNDKWIAVEQDFLSKLTEGTVQPEAQHNLTQKDFMSITADMQMVANEYLFTTDPAKAVITQASFVGTEQSEGITANHYKATLDQTNARAFCTSLVDKVSQNPAVKKIIGIPESNYTNAVQSLKDNCQKVEISSDEFDLWMDKKYKVFHKVRIYENLEKAKINAELRKASCLREMSEFNGMEAGASNTQFCDAYARIETGERYTEFGQVLISKQEGKLFINAVSATNLDTSTLRSEATVNTDELSLEGSIKAQSEEQKYNANLTFSTKPFEGTIDASKPADTIPIQQIIDVLGMNSFLSL